VTSATITGLTNGDTYHVRLRAKNTIGVSDYGPSASGAPSNVRTPGLYRGNDRIGSQNLTSSLSYISSNAVSGDEFYIVLGADESISPKTLEYYNYRIPVWITLLGYGGERTITLTSNGVMFTINNGVTLILDENITLAGRSTNNASLVTLYSGNLVINAGAKISGNNAGNSSGGGISVYNIGTTVTINGGTISGNTTSGDGGGIHVASGTVTMNGGTISGNTAANSGGGIRVASVNNGVVVMHGGTISGNTAANVGGGICGPLIKIPSGSGQNSGIIYGSDVAGVDTDGVLLRNTAKMGGEVRGDAVFSSLGNASVIRNTTVGQTDHINP